MLPSNKLAIAMDINIMWFRRDLRLEDNTALNQALTEGLPVLPLFIYDKNILDKLDDKADRRVEFIHAALTEMQQTVVAAGGSMEVVYGFPNEIFAKLTAAYSVKKVFTNHDYEPYATARDNEIATLLKTGGTTFCTYKDQVIFEKDDVVKDDGKPYTVFTPYSRKWKAALTEDSFKSIANKHLFKHFFQRGAKDLPTLQSMGFEKVGVPFPSIQLKESVLSHYSATRNFPANQKGTSRLGVHLRFGTISIRQLAQKASKLNGTYLNELIWRDFYHMILWHFPRVGMGRAFRQEYENIQWRNNQKEFDQWCNAKTGYPIVDAGMNELNQTGFMHNRVRMIVASFLTKHLLIDWRWGEAYFAQKLLDYDLAANNGGWQWAAGSGTDAAPYFRIFNPRLQTEKFDPKLEYIRKWAPEYEQLTYPQPMVVHEFARKRALEVYGNTLKK